MHNFGQIGINGLCVNAFVQLDDILMGNSLDRNISAAINADQ